MDGEMRLESSRPVVAVQPFVVAHADDEARFLAAGMHEDICGELTRFSMAIDCGSYIWLAEKALPSALC
jgi:TolB-like protein